jgi:hypothetical protein
MAWAVFELRAREEESVGVKPRRQQGISRKDARRGISRQDAKTQRFCKKKERLGSGLTAGRAKLAKPSRPSP